MIQVGRAGREACRAQVGFRCGKLTETGSQSSCRTVDRKMCILQRSALRGNFLLSGFKY